MAILRPVALSRATTHDPPNSQARHAISRPAHRPVCTSQYNLNHHAGSANIPRRMGLGIHSTQSQWHKDLIAGIDSLNINSISKHTYIRPLQTPSQCNLSTPNTPPLVCI
ncbi:uncharacterized protein SETTUDRAFT_164094 [Exserohilum turcica Et28A]|uniref:Uncharacterized protein n=1 Tax=Exserohilum turcicum (strain 28A) TaxID=671987 RepID=R0IK11_EXST2|nr:uncharacterized protein SETTUDRAFT_164094 [Exserohilum turcica Et28A]EOA85460.1 hypothetical protein SETTUDRAFT_164094 [Exserohilum turcica Et28A]